MDKNIKNNILLEEISIEQIRKELSAYLTGPPVTIDTTNKNTDRKKT